LGSRGRGEEISDQRAVHCGGRVGRAEILRVHAKNVTLGEGIDLDAVAALTPGFTGADLANLVNEATLRATRRGAEVVTADDFTAAIERIGAGIEKRSRLLDPHDWACAAGEVVGGTAEKSIGEAG
jgi:cell division protease FtsH